MSSSSTIRDVVVVGALLRRGFRTFLDVNDVQWRERKGLLDSDFIVTATAAEWRFIGKWCEVNS